jgi:chromosome segregation ATPase
VADQDLELRFSIKSDEAVAGVQAVADAVKKVGEALPPTTTAAKEATSQFSALGEAGQKVADAEAKLEKGGDSPRALIRAATEATLAVNALKKAMADAGTPITPELQASLDAVGKKAVQAAAQATTLTEELKNMRTAGAAAAQNVDALKGSVGSLDGFLQQMSVSGNSVMKSIGGLGKEVGLVSAAFTTGYALGKKFDEGLKSIGIDLSKFQLSGQGIANAFGGLAKTLADTGIFGAKLTGILNDMGKATGYYDDMLAPLPGRMNMVMKAHQAAAAEMQKYKDKLAELGYTWDDEVQKEERIKKAQEDITIVLEKARQKGEQYETTIRGMAPMLEQYRKDVESTGKSWETANAAVARAVQMAQALAEADKNQAESLRFRTDATNKYSTELHAVIAEYQASATAARGQANEMELVAQAEQKALAGLAALGEKYHETPKQMAEMVAAQGAIQGSMQETTEGAIKEQKAALDALGISFKDVGPASRTFIEVQRDFIATLKEGTKAIEENNKAIKDRNASIEAAQKADSDFAEAQKNGIVFQGQATTVMLTMAVATKEQTDALIKLLQAQNAYSDSVANTLTVASGWRDYLAELADSYNSGATSLINYKNALVAFATQLEQTFAGATGKAKDALNDMIATIQKLIETAGSGGGGPIDTSVTGQLNRMFNTP